MPPLYHFKTLRQALTVLALFLGTFFLSHSGIAELLDGIAAVVNDDIITFTDIKNEVGRLEESLRKAYSPQDPALAEEIRKIRKDALDLLIRRRLIIQQFNAIGGKIQENYIEDYIQQDIDEHYGRDRSVFIKTLEALGMNLETYKEKVRDKIIVQAMSGREISSEIIISPYKIEKYYKENPDEFREGEKVKLRLIYIKKSENEQENEGARNLAQEILLKLTTGSDFPSLAAVYSEGSEKNQGGELGFVNKESLREELRDTAFTLNPGQISKVIETKDGYYILQVEEKKPAKVTTLEEARDLIERLLIRKEQEKLEAKWIQSLKRKAYIRFY